MLGVVVQSWDLAHICWWYIAVKTVCLQDGGSRRPYEALLLLRPLGWQDSSQQQQQQLPTRDMAIFAVPGHHSRKPHLGRLLQHLLLDSPACLEVGSAPL